jgi:hypothetical protein
VTDQEKAAAQPADESERWLQASEWWDRVLTGAQPMLDNLLLNFLGDEAEKWTESVHWRTQHHTDYGGEAMSSQYLMHQNKKTQAMREALYEAIKDLAPADKKHLLEILRCDVASHLKTLEKEDGKQ